MACATGRAMLVKSGADMCTEQNERGAEEIGQQARLLGVGVWVQGQVLNESVFGLSGFAQVSQPRPPKQPSEVSEGKLREAQVGHPPHYPLIPPHSPSFCLVLPHSALFEVNPA